MILASFGREQNALHDGMWIPKDRIGVETSGGIEPRVESVALGHLCLGCTHWCASRKGHRSNSPRTRSLFHPTMSHPISTAQSKTHDNQLTSQHTSSLISPKDELKDCAHMYMQRAT